jgi:hypothetical protein
VENPRWLEKDENRWIRRRRRHLILEAKGDDSNEAGGEVSGEDDAREDCADLGKFKEALFSRQCTKLKSMTNPKKNNTSGTRGVAKYFFFHRKRLRNQDKRNLN